MKKIRLKAKHDRRFRSGHPWVYSNELQDSPKGIEAGEALELFDPAGKFLAQGYGNPASLIAFRAVSRDEAEVDATTPAGVARRLERAWTVRQLLGFAGVSHRLCFGEADQLPGLIVDHYALKQGGSVLVVQAQTAGADRWTRSFENILEEWSKIHQGGWLDRASVIIKNDSSSRKWECLAEEPARVLRSAAGAGDFSKATILVRSADPLNQEPLEFQADLLGGQKTGFFLDQWANIQLTLLRLERLAHAHGRRRLRMVDLCCYVGQWGAQITRYFAKRGIEVEVTLVDASRAALAQAEQNARNAGAVQVVSVCGNVLQDLGQFSDRSFDLVISDPPALIKNRKDIPVGTHAYLQLHTQAARLVADRGAWVACSCSGLLEEESFVETLAKAARRQGRQFSWVSRGAQSPDHPILAEFPEGRYLKAWIGVSP